MAIIAVFHADEIFTVGLNSRGDRSRNELNHLVPVKNVVELRWFGGYPYSRDRKGYSDDIPEHVCRRVGEKVSSYF